MLRLLSKGLPIVRYQCTQAACKVAENAPHTPVMANEVLHYLDPDPHHLILDMTFGAGGHSRKILETTADVTLLTLDRDPSAQRYMADLAVDYPGRIIPLLGRFSELPTLLSALNIAPGSIDGILFDYGCSSMQFDIAERGFSVSKNGPLDMRMDGDRFPDSITAAKVLANATEEDLYKILKVYGEEKQARKIARAIIETRYLFKKLTTTEELADLIDSVCGDEVRFDKLHRKSHNATKTFQALRIFVNNELNEINYSLILSQKYLKLGGKLITITFHSLEDTIVKRHMLGNIIQNVANQLPLKYVSHSVNIDNDFFVEALESNWKCLHKHVIVPSAEEVEANPRSRSAKLRAAVRIK
ncbi:hypothetical protein PPYR_00530 [Photinus pyralis]|uniref:Methyltransferase-like protein 15 homolog n=1 Tax=Photinus pyralis TaxID=7054 RepID=A0A1Y1M9E0_PHOPY|nr:probable methyltransferase-like protein 15 homolog [Photinus pyralis]XP_031341319.1 probable methyltransferase-like protein 15 homolog [Photinus pyralis]KAB0803560.1 hypothetical protein PPYR_00530 [Photinus pyralis]